MAAGGARQANRGNGRCGVCTREIDRVEYDSRQEPGGWIATGSSDSNDHRPVCRAIPTTLTLRSVSLRGEHSGDVDETLADFRGTQVLC